MMTFAISIFWNKGLKDFNTLFLLSVWTVFLNNDMLLLQHDDVIKWKYFSALLAICAGNSPVPGEFPAQRAVTRSFDALFDLHPNKRWVNNRGAGELRHHRAHYDVTVMKMRRPVSCLGTGSAFVGGSFIQFNWLITVKLFVVLTTVLDSESIRIQVFGNTAV